MSKVKRTLKLLSIGTLCAAIFAGTGISALNAGAETGEQSAEPTAITHENGSLFLPSSYEQYLPLNNPTDVAVCENYIAVADSRQGENGEYSVIYAYTRADGSYSTYTHDAKITKIGFSEGEKLYFSDTALHLYTLDFTTLTSKQLSVNSSTFFIAENLFYNACVSSGTVKLTAHTLTDADEPQDENDYASFSSNAQPFLTYYGGAFLCVFPESVRYYQHPQDNKTFQLSGDLNKTNGLSSVCTYQGELYYTAADGLYRFERASEGEWSGESSLILESSDLSALSVYGNDLYCVKDTSIRQIAITEGKASFTEYEIGASSPSAHRLGNAVNSVRAGNLLATADAGNKRISLYDFTAQKYSTIACDYTPDLLALDVTDGTTTLAVTDGTTSLYVYKNGELQFSQTHATNVTGIVCVYGAVYYTTDNNGYGKASAENDVPAYRASKAIALTSDVYGNLYAVMESGSVLRFTEAEFINKNTSGTPVEGVTLPANFTSLRADFEGNLYCLVGNDLYQNGKIFAKIDLSKAVYRDNLPSPTSFALAFEDNAVYVQYDDFIVRTEALSFPTLNAISSESLREQLFAPQSSLTLVNLSAGAIGFRTNLEEFKQGTENVFPYSHYFRTTENRRGILLGETASYQLVALFEQATHSYTASLFKTEKGYSTAVDKGEFWQEQSQTRYLTNVVSPCYFPCLIPALRAETLARATEVVQLGVVRAGDTADYDYALVEYQTENGKQQGYVPLSYLTAVAPLAEAQTFTVGYVRATAEGVTFTAEDGTSIQVTERTQAQVYAQENGFLVRISKEGKAYFATLTAEQLEAPFSDALRISLIVVLSVLAAIIIGLYVYFIPKRKKGS